MDRFLGCEASTIPIAPMSGAWSENIAVLDSANSIPKHGR